MRRDLESVPMQKKLSAPSNKTEEFAFNFDLELMKRALSSGVVSFPPGLTGEERRSWLRSHKGTELPTG